LPETAATTAAFLSLARSRKDCTITGKIMRIAHVIKVTSVAGAEKHLLTLLSGLRLRGFSPQLLMLVEASKPMDEFEAALNERDVPVHKFRINADFDPTLPPRLRRAMRLIKPH